MKHRSRSNYTKLEAEELSSMGLEDCSYDEFMGILEQNIKSQCHNPGVLVRAYLETNKLTKDQSIELARFLKKNQILDPSKEELKRSVS